MGSTSGSGGQGGGGQGAGAGLQDLADRVANLEHLLGVKLPLKKVKGCPHPTSLPPEAFSQVEPADK